MEMIELVKKNDLKFGIEFGVRVLVPSFEVKFACLACNSAFAWHLDRQPDIIDNAERPS